MGYRATLQEVEPAARDLRAPGLVDPAVHFDELVVVPELEGKLGLLAVQAVQGVLLVVLPDRHVLVQDVGDAHPERVPGGEALLGVRCELVYL